MEVELWDVYDRDRKKTGRTMVRGEEVKAGEYHLVVEVCVFHPDGRLLVQRRQTFKEGWPGRWAITAGGSAIRGESSHEAAERELFEEVGIRADLRDVRPKLTVNGERTFFDIYRIVRDINLEDLRLQEEEVLDARWATEEEIISMIRSGEFVPYYESLIHLLFDMGDRYGSICEK